MQARAIRLSGLFIVLGGAAAVLYAAALVVAWFGAWPQAVGWAPPPLPELSGGWLAALESWPRVHKMLSWVVANVHPAVLLAIAGALVIRAGLFIAGSQAHVLEAVKERRADRARRARYYREEAERIEPTFAPEAEKGKKAA